MSNVTLGALSTTITNLTTGTPVKISNNSLTVNNWDDLRVTSATTSSCDYDISNLSHTRSMVIDEFSETKKRITELEAKVDALQNIQNRFFC